MTASRNRTQCDDCGYPLDVTAPGVGEWCTGFTVNRRAGGANAVSCREGTGRYLCPGCVAVRQTGPTASGWDQPNLFSGTDSVR